MPDRLSKEMDHPGAFNEVSKQETKLRLGVIFHSFDKTRIVIVVRASSSRFDMPPKLLMRSTMSSLESYFTNALS